MPHPHATHTRATRESDSAIDDQDAPVVSVVGASEGEWPDGPKGDDVTTCPRHDCRVLGGHLQGSDPIQEHVTLDPGAAALGQRLGDVAGYRAIFVAILGYTGHR